MSTPRDQRQSGMSLEQQQEIMQRNLHERYIKQAAQINELSRLLSEAVTAHNRLAADLEFNKTQMLAYEIEILQQKKSIAELTDNEAMHKREIQSLRERVRSVSNSDSSMEISTSSTSTDPQRSPISSAVSSNSSSHSHDNDNWASLPPMPPSVSITLPSPPTNTRLMTTANIPLATVVTPGQNPHGIFAIKPKRNKSANQTPLPLTPLPQSDYTTNIFPSPFSPSN